MEIQRSVVTDGGAAAAPYVDAAARAAEIRRDDIRWLESRIGQLQRCNGARELKLAACYRKLLRQRRRALAQGDGRDESWRDYLC